MDTLITIFSKISLTNSKTKFEKVIKDLHKLTTHLETVL